jgi:hypothetical protein
MGCEMESQNSLKIHVLLDVVLCEVLNSDHYFERQQCLHCQKKRVKVLQKSVTIDQSRQHNIQKTGIFINKIVRI